MLCNANSYEATLFYLTVYYICSIFNDRYNHFINIPSCKNCTIE